MTENQEPFGVEEEKEQKEDKAKLLVEEIQVSGEALLGKIKEILHEGNVRRIIIKNEKGTSLLEVPLTLGVVGLILAPVWAALGALAALLTQCTIVVEKVQE